MFLETVLRKSLRNTSKVNVSVIQDQKRNTGIR